ncbi:uncharacterized protein TEOVI_000371600 [Trypanosoma equiperdum]|uniref:Uncharacterized protein n=1 Tax=Trypanosoma equiperdum TaxID=5694 RepID=A0A1G4II41_TRYEQ|nr:hypothetical protein, conserved [Trypanosoma equiperdum]
MSSSFLVPFTLNVRLSVSCSSLHDGLGGLLSLLRADDHSVKAGTMSRDPCADGERQDALRHLLSRDASVLSEIDFRGDIPAIEDFASTIRSVDSFEKGYISLIFREYCKRMGIISEWKASLQAAQRESSFPISGALLDTVIAEEASARAELHTSREHFVEWAKGVAPRWLETARNMGASKKTEDGAAERAQNQLETVIAQQFGFSGNDVVNSGPPSSPRVTGANSDALRRQAIAMIEQEQSLRRQEAKTRVASLLEQEEQLRCQMEERRQKRETEEKRHHQANMEAFCQQLRQEEESFRQRMEARESERLQLLEHIEAEEQWLSQRLADRERQRALEIEAKERAEREQRELYREHVEAEEELLRNRLQQYEASRKMEAEKARQKEKEDREELYEHVLAEEQLIRQRLEQREKEAERRARYELYHAGRADAGLGNTDSTLPEHSFGTQQLVGYQAINNSYTGVGLCGERQAFTSPQGHPHSYHQQVHSLPHVQHYQQQYLPQVITSPAQPSCYPVAPAVPQPATVYSPLTQSVVTPPYNHYVSYHPQGELRSPQPPQMFPGNHPYYLNR